MDRKEQLYNLCEKFMSTNCKYWNDPNWEWPILNESITLLDFFISIGFIVTPNNSQMETK